MVTILIKYYLIDAYKVRLYFAVRKKTADGFMPSAERLSSYPFGKITEFSIWQASVFAEGKCP